ncbi:AraC family transcriptional regulator [Arthrospiribacter ruber]|uniref:AraC family transcriptional regulator n=2 Tax=Arthrospiribacter ruber TaxID=2487934 RepID=A0A951IYH0_9BACT|nr:AraC family transcriptional regulator [Arthrospiribacter ruber]
MNFSLIFFFFVVSIGAIVWLVHLSCKNLFESNIEMKGGHTTFKNPDIYSRLDFKIKFFIRPEKIGTKSSKETLQKNILKYSFHEEILPITGKNGLNYKDREFLVLFGNKVKENIRNEHFGVSELSYCLHMSRKNLHRKIKILTGVSPCELIRNIRLSKSVELLNSGKYSVSEISYLVGFSSVSYFSKCFSDRFGVPPSKV